VDVAGDLLARQGTELLPAPAARLLQLADDREVPQLEWCVWRRSGREDGEVSGDVLAGGDAGGIYVRSATAAGSARDERHHCLPSAGCSLGIHGCSAIDRSRSSPSGGMSVLLVGYV